MEPHKNISDSAFVAFIVSLFSCSLFSFLETSITAMLLFKLKELAKRIGK